ncbi:MAG: insulinase family protein [Bacteroidales bacterium]|nr:insulinase family protein [Bacteroidales bacterium]
MKRFFILLAAMIAAAAAFGQTPLPNDPAVKVGKLDNGMTYYIRHNALPEGRAEFHLVTNVGAVQENDQQDGLAHFLEHMCFNGTKNLPGKMLLEYLQSIGAEFGRNINAATGYETTTYMLNNIPVSREGIVDTCLLVMHDYSHFVTCDPVEIDAERGVILEEKRTRNTAQWRNYQAARKYYFGNTVHSQRTLIGSEEQLKTFKPEVLVDFYQTWYRPDMQALIVVGDIDVDQIEAKIRTMFADIPAPVDPRPKDVVMIPENAEPIVGIITDPETQNSQLELIWKSVPIPEEYNNTDVAYMTEYMKTIIYYVMQERFTDITSKPDAPYFSGMFGTGKMCETMEAAIGRLAFKDGDAINALKAFYTEIEKMKRFGFTDAEVERANAKLLSYAEKAAEGADTRKSAEFVDALIDNFCDNLPYMDPAMELQIVQALGNQLNAEIINQVAPQLITDNNFVLVYTAPEKEGLTHPTEAELIAAIEEVKASDIQANAAEEAAEPLLDPATLKGSKVKKEGTGIYNTVEWTLKNGAKVIVLPTDYKKDEIRINIYQDGGMSLIPTEDMPSFEANIAQLFFMNSGISKFPKSTLRKMLAGKNVSMNVSISAYQHGVSGMCAPKDLETALQLAYLFYADPRFDQDEYNTGVNQLAAILPNYVTMPDFLFQKEFTKVLYGDSARQPVISEEVLEKANLETIEKNYRKLFKDAAGMTAVIVGNVNPDELKPLVEKYIGSIAKGKKALKWVDNNDDIVKGSIKHPFNVKMEAPKSSVLQVYTAYMPVNPKMDVTLDAAKYILDMIYTATLREGEGGTYGASVGMATSIRPKERAIIQVMFDTNPESAEKLSQLAIDGLKRLAYEGPTEDEFSKAILNAKKNLPESRISNSYWSQNIRLFETYGYDNDKEYEEALESVTPEDIKTVLQAILEQNNFIEVRMLPEE